MIDLLSSDDTFNAGEDIVDTGFIDSSIDLCPEIDVIIPVSNLESMFNSSYDPSFGSAAGYMPQIYDAAACLNDISDAYPNNLLGRFAGRFADYLTGATSLEMASIKEAVENSSKFFNTVAPHIYEANDAAHFRWNERDDYMIGGNQQMLEVIGIGSQDSVEFSFAHEFIHYMQHNNPIDGISKNSKLNEMTSDFCAAFKSGAEERSVDEIKDFMSKTGSNDMYPDGEVRAQIIELGHTLGGKYIWKDFQSVSTDLRFSFNNVADIINEFKDIDESMWSLKVSELQDDADNAISFAFHP